MSIRAPCCKQWYDCAECHAEKEDHLLRKTNEMTFMCKKCKKAFRKDMSEYEESDEYCPHCDNHYVSYLSWSPSLLINSTKLMILGSRSQDTTGSARSRGWRPEDKLEVSSWYRTLNIIVSVNTIHRLLKDQRVKESLSRSIFNQDVTDRLG